MIEFIAAASTAHSQLFGGLWYLLVIAALGHMVFGGRESRAGASGGGSGADGVGRRADGSNPDWKFGARTWFIAFGPLLFISIASVLIFDLTWSRIEVLEMFLGGIIFLGLMGRTQLSATRLAHACAVGGLMALAVAANDVGWQGFARAGVESHPINFGIASGALLLMLLLAMWHGQRTLLLGLGAAGAGVALLLSGSRGPMLALMAVVLALLLMQVWRRRSGTNAPKTTGSAQPRKVQGTVARGQNRHRPWLLVGGGLALSAVVLAAVVVRSLHDLQFGEVSSLGLRWRILIETLRQIGEHPWLGLGVDQAGAFYATLNFPVDDINHAHNTLLNTTLEMGIAGGLAWCWVFVALARGFHTVGFNAGFSAAGAAAASRGGDLAQVNRPAMYIASSHWPWIAGLALLAYFFLCAMTQDVLSHSYTRKLMTFHLALLLALAMQTRRK